jgi:hypothetical protein
VLLFFDGDGRHRVAGWIGGLFRNRDAEVEWFELMCNDEIGKSKSLVLYVRVLSSNSSDTCSHNKLAYFEAMHVAFVSVCVARVVGMPISDQRAAHNCCILTRHRYTLPRQISPLELRGSSRVTVPTSRCRGPIVLVR